MVTPPPKRAFHIASGLPQDAAGRPYVLAIQGADKDPGASVVYYPMGVSDPSQIWTMDGDGRILSQLNGCALTWDESHSQLMTAVSGDPSYPSQLWTVTLDGYVQSQVTNDDVLTAYPASWTVTLTTQWGDDYGNLQNWTLISAEPSSAGDTARPLWVYIRTALQDSQGDYCVFNVQGGSTAPGTPVIVWPLGTVVGNNDLWQITPDGRILSDQGNNLVLTLSTALEDGGNCVTVDTQRDPLPLTQVWDVSTPNQIASAFSGEFLVPAGGTENPATLNDGDPILAAPGDTQNPSYTWYTVPASPLQAVMAQPPVPFQVFQGDEATAYGVINSRLGVTSLRDEYYNLTRTLSDYANQISSWTQAPDGILQADWDAVRGQLITEISYADATRDLFSNYGDFQTDLFTDNNALTNALIVDAGMDPNSGQENVGGLVLSIFEGLAYTGLSAAGEGYAVAANLMEMAIDIALAADSGSGSSISPDPFQVAVSDLWTELSNNYTALLSAMGDMEIAILKDWGKLEAVYKLTEPDGEGDSLYWDPTTTGDLVTAARPGYKTAVMQMLLPAKYQIYVVRGIPGFDVPASAQWQTGGQTYWIADIGNLEEFPADATMQNDIWGNGVRKQDFFLSAAGWGFPTTNEQGSGENGTLTFTNLTPNMIRLTSGDAGISVDIAPYQSGGGILYFGTFDFQVTDLNNPDVDQITQFTMEVWTHFASEVARITITPSDSIDPGYRLTPAICNVAISDLSGAAAQLSLTQV